MPTASTRKGTTITGKPVGPIWALASFVHVDGKSVTIPDDVGRNEGGGYLTVIHTHDSSGIVHIEAPKGPHYNLGQVFDVWGVRFTPTCLGASIPP